MSEIAFHFGSAGFSRPRRLKAALLASFSRPASEAAARLAGFSERDWRAVLFWLDISGIALYVLNQLTDQGLDTILPKSILARLHNNLRDNQLRTTGLMREANFVAEKFKTARIHFALLKGVTLMPGSVPECSLRLQTDLDLLIRDEDTRRACHLLESLGYALHAVSGQTMEFRAGVLDVPDFGNLYRPQTQRVLELHLLTKRASSDRLTRTKSRFFYGVSLPALSGPDILVQQAVHLFKHVCGEHTRVSWVLEFWRHVRSKEADEEFWHEVMAIAAIEPNGDLALGVSLWLATELFGAVATEAVKRWKPDQLPKGVQRWLRKYGREMLIADSVGSKLYLILRRQLAQKESGRPQPRKLLFPIHLPLRVSRARPNETLTSRLTRYHVEARHFCFRLRFHIIEGLRYAIESLRWQLSSRRVE